MSGNHEGFIDVPGPGGGGAETQTAVSGIANSETTYTSGTVNLSGLGQVVVRSTTGNAFQFSVPAQSVQPAQTGISGISNSETLYNSGTVNLSGLGEVVVRSTTGNAFQISAPAHTVQTGISSIAGSDATYTSGQVQFTGSNMVTVKSSANQRIVIDATQSVQPQSVQAESLSFGVSTGGNTVGDTGVNTGQRIVLSGQGQVSLSQATGANSTTVGISVPNSHAVQTGISGISNSETTYTSGTVGLSALTNITIRSTTGNAFQFSVADAGGPGGAGVTLSRLPEVDDAWTYTSINNVGTFGTTGGSTQWTYSMHFSPLNVYAARVNFDQLHAQLGRTSSTAGTGSGTEGLQIGLYTLNASTLSKVSDFFWVDQMSQNSATAVSHRWYWAMNAVPSSTTRSSSVNGNITATFNGSHEVIMLDEQSASIPGGQYAIGWVFTRATSSVSVHGAVSIAMRGANISTTGNLVFGTNALQSQAPAMRGFVGMVSSTSNSNSINQQLLPASIATSLLTANQTLTSAWRPIAFTAWSNAD